MYQMSLLGQTDLIAQAWTTPFAGSRLGALANSSRGEDVEQDAVPQIETVFEAAVPMPVVAPKEPGEIDEVSMAAYFLARL